MIYDDGTLHMVGWLACPFPLRNDHFGLGGMEGQALYIQLLCLNTPHHKIVSPSDW
jgi:hypothetical protein